MIENLQYCEDWLITPFPNPFVLPAITLTTDESKVFQELPTISAIYFILVPAHDRVLYIGRSDNLRWRFISPGEISSSILHYEAKRAIQTGLESGGKVTITWIETNNQLPYPPSCLETHLIAKFQPLFNQQGKDTKRYAARQRLQRLPQILNTIFQGQTVTKSLEAQTTAEVLLPSTPLPSDPTTSQIITSQARTLALLTEEIEVLRKQVDDLERERDNHK